MSTYLAIAGVGNRMPGEVNIQERPFAVFWYCLFLFTVAIHIAISYAVLSTFVIPRVKLLIVKSPTLSFDGVIAETE